MPYSESIVVKGGFLPYTYAITASSLPSGLTLNPVTGFISGTSDMIAGQSQAFTVRVTDSGNPSDFAEKPLSINVLDPLTITTLTIQGALQKSFYQTTFAGNGGLSSPYTWTIQSGVHPQGLTLDDTSGILSGISIFCGDFDFTVQMTDSAPVPNATTRAFNLHVNCCNDYDLSGGIFSLQGVTVAMSGNMTATATTDGSGNYKFQHLTNGNYTLTPSKFSYWFEPESKTVTVNNFDMSGADFVAHLDTTPPTGSITINGGANFINNASTVLTLSATDEGSGMSQMCISNTSSCTTWENYATTKEWTLSGGEGTKTV